jgi:hypothetical protein
LADLRVSRHGADPSAPASTTTNAEGAAAEGAAAEGTAAKGAAGNSLAATGGDVAGVDGGAAAQPGEAGPSSGSSAADAGALATAAATASVPAQAAGRFLEFGPPYLPRTLRLRVPWVHFPLPYDLEVDHRTPRRRDMRERARGGDRGLAVGDHRVSGSGSTDQNTECSISIALSVKQVAVLTRRWTCLSCALVHRFPFFFPWPSSVASLQPRNLLRPVGRRLMWGGAAAGVVRGRQPR